MLASKMGVMPLAIIPMRANTHSLSSSILCLGSAIRGNSKTAAEQNVIAIHSKYYRLQSWYKLIQQAYYGQLSSKVTSKHKWNMSCSSYECVLYAFTTHPGPVLDAYQIRSKCVRMASWMYSITGNHQMDSVTSLAISTIHLSTLFHKDTHHFTTAFTNNHQ